MKDAKKKEPKQLTGFRLSSVLVGKLNEEARATRRSRAVIVEMALEQFFGKKRAA